MGSVENPGSVWVGYNVIIVLFNFYYFFKQISARQISQRKEGPTYLRSERHPLQDPLNRAEAQVHCAPIPPPQTLLWGLPEAIDVKMTSAFLA